MRAFAVRQRKDTASAADAMPMSRSYGARVFFASHAVDARLLIRFPERPRRRRTMMLRFMRR